MSEKNRAERKADQVTQEECVSKTTGKVAAEAISDEVQAPAYQPKFKSFSRELGAAKTGSAVAEFVLEDKHSGKEYTASGERNVARHSFLQGLKTALESAKTPDEEEAVRAFFSIEYILRKASGLVDSVSTAVSKRFDTLMLPGSMHSGSTREGSASQGENWLVAQADKVHKQDVVSEIPLTQLREFKDTPSAVVGEFKRILAMKNRDEGEYHAAISRLDKRTFGSGLFFGPGLDIAGYETHMFEPNAAIAQLTNNAVAYALEKARTGGKVEEPFKIAAVLHSHPNRKDHDPWVFSDLDANFADRNNADSYLLRPDNVVLYYKPHSRNLKGEVVGHFDRQGNFIPEEKFAAFGRTG